MRWEKAPDPPPHRSWEVEAEEELAERCLFPRLLSSCSLAGRRRTRRGSWAPGWLEALAKTTGSSCFFLQKEQRGRGSSFAGGSPVAAKHWEGSFLWPHLGSHSNAPWAPAGLGLAEMFLLSALRCAACGRQTWTAETGGDGRRQSGSSVRTSQGGVVA